jgi:hypothetical protein
MRPSRCMRSSVTIHSSHREQRRPPSRSSRRVAHNIHDLAGRSVDGINARRARSDGPQQVRRHHIFRALALRTHDTGSGRRADLLLSANVTTALRAPSRGWRAGGRRTCTCVAQQVEIEVNLKLPLSCCAAPRLVEHVSEPPSVASRSIRSKRSSKRHRHGQHNAVSPIDSRRAHMRSVATDPYGDHKRHANLHGQSHDAASARCGQ